MPAYGTPLLASPASPVRPCAPVPDAGTRVDAGGP